MLEQQNDGRSRRRSSGDGDDITAHERPNTLPTPSYDDDCLSEDFRLACLELSSDEGFDMSRDTHPQKRLHPHSPNTDLSKSQSHTRSSTPQHTGEGGQPLHDGSNTQRKRKMKKVHYRPRIYQERDGGPLLLDMAVVFSDVSSDVSSKPKGKKRLSKDNKVRNLVIGHRGNGSGRYSVQPDHHSNQSSHHGNYKYSDRLVDNDEHSKNKKSSKVHNPHTKSGNHSNGSGHHDNQSDHHSNLSNHQANDRLVDCDVLPQYDSDILVLSEDDVLVVSSDNDSCHGNEIADVAKCGRRNVAQSKDIMKIFTKIKESGGHYDNVGSPLLQHAVRKQAKNQKLPTPTQCSHDPATYQADTSCKLTSCNG